MTVHCLPRLYLSQTHLVTLKKPPFFHHFSFNLQEEGMGFLILTKYFMFIALFSWICVLLLRYKLYVARIWVGFVFVEFGCLGFIEFDFRVLDILDIIFILEFVFWFVLCWTYHTHWNMSYRHVLKFSGFCDSHYLWVSLVHYGYLVHISLCVWLCTLGCSCCVSVHTVTLCYA